MKITTRVDLDENPLFSIPVEMFCAWMTFAPIFDTWDIPAVFDNLEQTITLENTSGAAFAAYMSNEQWRASEGVVSFENEVVQIDNVTTFDQVIAILDLLAEEAIGGVYITSAGGTTIRDIVSGTPLDTIIMQAGYECGFKFDVDLQQVTIFDNQAHEFIVSANPSFNPNNFLNFYTTFGANNVNKFVNKLNTGSSAFSLPQSEGTYCNQIYVPPSYCSTVPLSIIPFGAAQTTNIVGQSVQAISLGNDGVTDVISGAEFITATDEVKFEMYIDSIAPNPLNSGGASIIFLDFATFTLVAGVSITPDTVSGTLFDIVDGVPIANINPIVDGYESAAYLDAAGTARFKDSNGIDVVIGVDALYNNANEITQAALIDAGTNLGDEINVTMNFGNTAFQLGEDAMRWCEV